MARADELGRQWDREDTEAVSLSSPAAHRQPTEASRRALRWASWALLIASLVLLAAVAWYAALNSVSSTDPRPPEQVTLEQAYRIDLEVYRLGGQTWASGGDLYGLLPDTEIGVNLPFTYPPIAAVLFAPLSLIPLWQGGLIFSIATVACLALVVWLVLRELTSLPVPLLLSAASLVTVLAVGTEPVWRTIGFGQINVFLMTLVVVDVLVGRGRWWQGCLIGLAIAVKLTPVVFLAYFLMRRDMRALAVTAGSALAYTGLGFVLAFRDSIEYWTHALGDPSRIGHLGYVGNQSINGALYRITLGGGLPVVWFALCAALGLATLPLARRLFAGGQDAAAMTVFGVYALLASPVSWTHHWVWFVPATLVLLTWAARVPGPMRWVALAVALAGAYLFDQSVPWTVPYAEAEVPPWSLAQHLSGNAYVWWGLAFLAVAWGCSAAGAARRPVSAAG